MPSLSWRYECNNSTRKKENTEAVNANDVFFQEFTTKQNKYRTLFHIYVLRNVFPELLKIQLEVRITVKSCPRSFPFNCKSGKNSAYARQKHLATFHDERINK